MKYVRWLWRGPVLAAVFLGMCFLGLAFLVGDWADRVLDDWTAVR